MTTKKKNSSKPLSKTKKSSKQKVKEPQTMEELLAQTGYKIHGFKRGEIVEGKIVSLSPREILIDVGGKSYAIVSPREFEFIKDLVQNLSVGDKVTARVALPENEEGQIVLSLRRTAFQKRWEFLQEAAKKREEIEVVGTDVIRGGLLTDFYGIRGFIPASCLSPEFAGQPERLRGRRLKVKVLEVDRNQNRLVISQKAVISLQQREKQEKALKKIKLGEVYKAKVAGIAPFGVFMDVGGVEGLVHISEIAWEKVGNPSDYFKIGDEVKVKVLEIDKEQGKLNLSCKQLTPDPWENIEKKYKKDKTVKGKVTRVSPYGAFVSLEKGIEGLIHISKIPPGQELKEKDVAECVVERIDKEKRKISLSLVPKGKPVGYR